MKIPLSRVAVWGRRHHRPAAYTLIEVVTVMALFGIIMEAVVYTHVFGSRLFVLANSKMGASDSARNAISMMVDDIRSAKIVEVGSGTLSTFTWDTTGTNQTGNAIQIYPTTNQNYFVRYFLDPNAKMLMRTTNGAMADLIIAEALTNTMIFSAQDGYGNVLTNRVNNRAIAVTMQFYQLSYPAVVPVGPGQLYSHYQLRTVATRRVLQ